MTAHPAHVGDSIVLYAIGLGPTSPAVATGAPAPYPAATLTLNPEVIFGESPFGTKVEPFFAGLSPNFAGLYQVNVTIPSNFPGRGPVLVSLVFADGTASNAVNVEIQ